MNNCIKCGAELREGAKFCNKCGEPVQTKVFCHQCGVELEPNDMFCHVCGASMQKKVLKNQI